MISVILIEPEWASNVGAVCRIMANFGFYDLVLVNPKCDKDSLDGVKRAKHAIKILRDAKIVSKIPKFDYLIATTSKLGSDYNIPRSPIFAQELAEKLRQIKQSRKKIGLVFGREGEGLHNTEIEICDFIVTIPSSKKYSALNLSHAVGIILYELHKKLHKEKVGDQISVISYKEKENLCDLIDSVLDKMEFNTLEKKKTQKILWKRLIGKSMLTKREAFSLFGFFRKIK